MDPNDITYSVRPLGERVSVLETRQDATEGKLDEVIQKLDELLELKQKGMGAVSFISMLVLSASGIAGVIAFVVNFFNGK